MLVSLKWLNTYVTLPTNLDVDKFAETLAMASAEVDAVISFREFLDLCEVYNPNADST